MSRRINTLLTVAVGSVLIAAIAAIVALNLDKFLATAGMGQAIQEPEYSAQDTEGTDWHTIARYLEKTTPVDVVSMGERNGTAFAALCLEETATDDEIYLIGQLALHALLVFGDENNEYIVLSFLLEPEGDDPRYPLQWGFVCQVDDGEIRNCEGASLLGGYLSPDSVRWPGRE